MKVEEHIHFWLSSAEHDLETAESMFNACKYDWCLFISHLVLEKTLKAFYVRDNENRMPPKTHNLIRLAEQTSLCLTDEQRMFLDEVNDFNIETRYPEYKQEFYKRCTKDIAENYFLKIKEYRTWLISQLK